MILKLKEFLKKYDIDGTIVLYRSEKCRKWHLCEYLIAKGLVKPDITIGTTTCGAFGLALATLCPNNKVEIRGQISPEYKKQLDKLPNVEYVAKFSEGAQVIDQYTEPLVLAHYKEYFPKILSELKDEKIDAFCDCGHTCGAFVGLMDSGLKHEWTWILGVAPNIPFRMGNFHIRQSKNNQKIVYSKYIFDTVKLQTEIETAYPEFGNVFEATRSISAAMEWLKTNPGKTVLVYVGDGKVFGDSK